MRLEITAPAQHDLSRIYEFNLGYSIDRAEKVDERLLRKAASLIDMPRIGRPMSDSSARRLSAPDIGYVIDYDVGEDVVQVLRFQSMREVRDVT